MGLSSIVVGGADPDTRNHNHASLMSMLESNTEQLMSVSGVHSAGLMSSLKRSTLFAESLVLKSGLSSIVVGGADPDIPATGYQHFQVLLSSTTALSLSLSRTHTHTNTITLDTPKHTLSLTDKRIYTHSHSTHTHTLSPPFSQTHTHTLTLKTHILSLPLSLTQTHSLTLPDKACLRERLTVCERGRVRS